MSNNLTVLVVDDSTESRMLLSVLLEDDYTIIQAKSGASCLEIIAKQIPDILLLDVNMPDMTGYEVCTALRKKPETARLPIIFVSALETVEERLQGYEAGGDGYIIKPVDGEALLSKVRECLEEHHKLDKVQQEANSAMKLAMEAMTVSSELGQIIEFIKTLQGAHDLDAVGQAVLSMSKGFCLEVSTMITTSSSRLYVGCGPNSMESKVLDRASISEDRILSVGVYTIVRNKHIALLIKNMPEDNENLYGRLKDHLAVLMDIADGHIIALDALVEVGRQRKIFMGQLIAMSEQKIKTTSKKISEYETSSRKIIEDMLSGLENMLFGLGLEDDQEAKLMSLANETSEKLRMASKETQNLDADIGLILESLYEFMERET